METGPDPSPATTPAEFVTALRQLRLWADLSYRQLERRAADAGDVLPRATIAGALARDDLPREELLTAYVRACGATPQTVETWLAARRRIAITTEAADPQDAATGPLPAAEHAPPAQATEPPDEPGLAPIRPQPAETQSPPGDENLAEAEEKPAPPAAKAKRRAARRRSALLVAVIAAALAPLAVWLWPSHGSRQAEEPERTPPITSSPIP
ncbi:hypothetical protein ACSNOD_05640, partial [Streptomyces sp. URMC 123]